MGASSLWPYGHPFRGYLIPVGEEKVPGWSERPGTNGKTDIIVKKL